MVRKSVWIVVMILIVVIVLVGVLLKANDSGTSATIPTSADQTSTTSENKLSPDVQYTINLPNGLMLTDSDGRRTGEDPATGAILNEIPNTSYQEQERSGYLLISQPVDGNYTIQIIGAQTGGYAFSNEVFDGQQDAVYQVLRGNINAGQTITYTQNYDPKNLASSTVVLASSTD